MNVDLRHGDCVELMRAMPDCSVDSVVTDPPYELGFMGKAWDGAGIAYSLDMWREALRVLKPGGHLLAFGGTRTYHRMACAIEDAGFEIRDSIHWVYGSGFPKSLDVSKAIDKRRDERHEEALVVTVPMAEAMRAKGLTRRDLNVAVGREPNDAGSAQSWTTVVADGAHKPRVPTVEQWAVLRDLLDLAWLDDEVWRLNGRKGSPGEAWSKREVIGTKTSGIANREEGPRHTIGASKAVEVDVTTAATDEARRWAGWGTALKPAHEPVVVARKPLESTVAGNVLVWGTGGLNIDGCRVGTDGGTTRGDGGGRLSAQGAFTTGHAIQQVDGGRWPANIVLDGAAADALDQQSGVLHSQNPATRSARRGKSHFGSVATDDTVSGAYADKGGASRFFTQADFGPDDWPFVYCAKPSKRERNAGLDGLPQVRGVSETFDPKQRDGVGDDRMPVRANHHPTVKPVALMRHLVRLVTPPGGTVLDPFAGSGTTLVAAVLEGMNAVGCEMTDEYLPIIEGRVAWAQEQVASQQPRLL